MIPINIYLISIKPHILLNLLLLSLVKMLRKFYSTLMHLKSLDQILSVPAFSKKELTYLLYHTQLLSTVPLIRDTSQTLGKKQMFCLFIKRTISFFQVTTGQYLSYAKLEKQWSDVSINIASNQILTPLQSGFVPGDSTTCQLLHIYHMFC